MKKSLTTILSLSLAVSSVSQLTAAERSIDSGNDSQMRPIVHGQVYGKGSTKNAAYGDAFRKIPSGYTAVKVSYTSGTSWNCRIEWGK